MGRPKTGLDRSRAQEARLVELRSHRNSVSHAGSGNQWRQKNDLHDDDFWWECKRTDGEKGITIKVVDLEDNRRNAVVNDRTPVFHLEIGEATPKRYVVLTEDDFLTMAERLEDIHP